MRNPLKMNIKVVAVGYQRGIRWISAGILRVFCEYSMGIESRLVDAYLRWKSIIC